MNENSGVLKVDKTSKPFLLLLILKKYLAQNRQNFDLHKKYCQVNFKICPS